MAPCASTADGGEAVSGAKDLRSIEECVAELAEVREALEGGEHWIAIERLEAVVRWTVVKLALLQELTANAASRLCVGMGGPTMGPAAAPAAVPSAALLAALEELAGCEHTHTVRNGLTHVCTACGHVQTPSGPMTPGAVRRVIVAFKESQSAPAPVPVAALPPCEVHDMQRGEGRSWRQCSRCSALECPRCGAVASLNFLGAECLGCDACKDAPAPAKRGPMPTPTAESRRTGLGSQAEAYELGRADERFAIVWKLRKEFPGDNGGAEVASWIERLPGHVGGVHAVKVRPCLNCLGSGTVKNMLGDNRSCGRCLGEGKLCGCCDLPLSTGLIESGMPCRCGARPIWPESGDLLGAMRAAEGVKPGKDGAS